MPGIGILGIVPGYCVHDDRVLPGLRLGPTGNGPAPEHSAKRRDRRQAAAEPEHHRPDA